MTKILNTTLVLSILSIFACASGPEVVKKNYKEKTTTMKILMRAFDSQEESKNKIIQKIPCPNHEILEEEIKGDTVHSNQMEYNKKANSGAGGYKTTTTSYNVKYLYLTYRCK